MLKQFKQATLRSLKAMGVFQLVRNSRWRQRRLLILAYHGISIEDEHWWNPLLYMSPELFRVKLQLLKRTGCNVLPLSDALKLLLTGKLPERCVALTFDDGNYDFYARAYPILKEFDYPSTLYLTTFYSEYNKPVFDVISSYLLWKGRGATLDLKPLTGQAVTRDLARESARTHTCTELKEFARQNKMSAEEKDTLAATLAKQLKIDYDALLAKRILHLLLPSEVEQIASDGVDVELHTHRHRVPLDHALFVREIEDNRDSIQAMTGTRASHFCYPSGIYVPEFLPWLKELGVVSATTSDPGIAARNTNHLLLPRLLDTSRLPIIELEGWLAGVAAMLPRRS